MKKGKKAFTLCSYPFLLNCYFKSELIRIECKLE